MKRLLLTILLTTTALGLTEPAIDQLQTKLEAPIYQFKGTHYMASFYGCDSEAINNRIYLIAYFVKAIDLCGATLLRFNQYSFKNNALTAVALLSESHASIHTYPEYNAVFVDLFTCGDSCDWKPFERTMKEMLNPSKIRRKVRVRR